MIEFQAGTGPDSQAISIALEEMHLPYNIAQRRAPVPVTVVGQARLPGANNILMALARKTSRFLPDPADAEPWLAKQRPGDDVLEAKLAAQEFILGAYSIVDMAIYPLFARRRDVGPATAAWVKRMALRPGVGRGMMAVAG